MKLPEIAARRNGSRPSGRLLPLLTAAKHPAAGPLTAKPTTPKPTGAKPRTTGPLAARQLTTKPRTTSPLAARQLTAKPRTTGPLAARPLTTKPRTTSPLAAGLLIAGLLVGCGSTEATHTTGSAAATPNTAHAQTTVGGQAASPALAPTACAKIDAGTMRTVAARIYREAATGGDVAQAVHRVQSSSALTEAVNSGDATAANAALRELLVGQIVRIEVLRGGRVLARAGSGSAIAPVRGSIPGTSATFVLSTQASHSYTEVVHQVTGARISLTTGYPGGTAAAPTARSPGAPGAAGNVPAVTPGAAAGTPAGYRATTLTGTAYPEGPVRIVLLVPTAGVSCPGSAAQARVETLGKVGELIYAEELHSPDVARTVEHIEASKDFQEAVAAREPVATRNAIVGFFREHIHVVRVRVNTGAGPLVDVGGPYVLAPVAGTVRKGDKTVGRFEMAIQDDAGYLKLARLFTGAEVLMREGRRQVMGTLAPGPAAVPDRGTISYGGRTYEAYSFTGTAFPEGSLRISLLLPVA